MSQKRVFARRQCPNTLSAPLPPKRAWVKRAALPRWDAPGTSPPREGPKPGVKGHTCLHYSFFRARTSVHSAGGSLNDVQHGGGVPSRGCGHGVGLLAVICVFALKGDVGSAHRSREEK